MDTRRKILDTLIANHPDKAITIIETYPIDEIVALFDTLSMQQMSQLMSRMDRRIGAECLKKLDFEHAVQLIESLPVGVTRVLFDQMDKGGYHTLLDGLSDQTSRSLKQLLTYPTNTVGAFTEPRVFTLTDDLTIEEAIHRIRRDHPFLFSHVFVLNRQQILVGYLNIRTLITTENDKAVRSVMEASPPKIIADMNIRVLQEGKGWMESFPYLAVVDINDVFLGLITREVVSKVGRQDATEMHAHKASSALGDLYQIGLGSLLRTMSEISEDIKTKSDGGTQH